LAYIDPVGSLVTGTLKSLFINKALQQKDGMVISFYPIRAYTPGNFSQDMAGKMGNFHPGQDQKSPVVS